jgi:hypothetical protein
LCTKVAQKLYDEGQLFFERGNELLDYSRAANSLEAYVSTLLHEVKRLGSEDHCREDLARELFRGAGHRGVEELFRSGATVTGRAPLKLPATIGVFGFEDARERKMAVSALSHLATM